MKKTLFITLAIAVVVSLGACSNAKKTEKVVNETEKEVIHEGHDHEGHDHEGHHHESEEVQEGEATAMLCGSCGQIKGSENCCIEGTVKCDKCGLDKDSPGCCKITADTKLCTHCGEIAGGDACCKEGAAICEKCGLHAESPGCCKI